MIVFNDSGSPVGMPGAGVIQPGASALVENWEEVKALPIVSVWLKKGVIREQPESAEPLPKESDDEGSEGDE